MLDWLTQCLRQTDTQTDKQRDREKHKQKEKKCHNELSVSMLDRLPTKQFKNCQVEMYTGGGGYVIF